MSDWLLISIVIAVFSVVQSLFGVGLLVFGTPALLLLGLPFESALAALLPASLAISLAQTVEGRAFLALPRAFFPWTIPFVIAGLALVLTGAFRPDMQIVVGVMLVATALLRFSPSVRARLRALIERRFRFCLAATGLIHGLSNLGGAPLTIIMSSLHQDRQPIRANIALSYLSFSAIQFIVLASLKPSVLSASLMWFPVISLTVYFLAGNRAYRKTSETAYQGMLTAFTLCFGLALFARKFL